MIESHHNFVPRVRLRRKTLLRVTPPAGHAPCTGNGITAAADIYSSFVRKPWSYVPLLPIVREFSLRFTRLL